MQCYFSYHFSVTVSVTVIMTFRTFYINSEQLTTQMSYIKYYMQHNTEKHYIFILPTV